MALALASGLGSVAGARSDVRIPTTRSPHVPVPMTIDPTGERVIGSLENIPVLGIEGRLPLRQTEVREIEALVGAK